MRIAIIGTGNVGDAIARVLKGKGDWQPLPCRFQHGEGDWRILGLADTTRAPYAKGAPTAPMPGSRCVRSR